MLHYEEVGIETLTKRKIDARSSCADFNHALLELHLISNYPGSYAKDHNYRDYGFSFISSDHEAEAFLKTLDKDNDDLDTVPIFKWGCTKAKSIRHGMLKRWNFCSSLEQFKALASSARRTECCCHDTGSFRPR